MITETRLGRADPFEDESLMTIYNLTEGSSSVARNLGPVSVSQCLLAGIESSTLTQHAICLYPVQSVHSVEQWEGKTYLRKHWEIGSVAFIPAGSELRSKPDHPYRETLISFQPSLIERATEGIIEPGQIDWQFTDITDAGVFGFSNSVSALAMVTDIEQWPLLVECATLALAVSIIRKLAPAGALASIDQRHILCDVRMRRVCEFVEAHLFRRIGLQELADVAVLSQYHFSRQFTAQAGMSPLRYVLSRRVELAKAKLVKPGVNLADVAYVCGFSGQSHFTTTFKTFTGATPGEYRRERCPPLFVAA